MLTQVPTNEQGGGKNREGERDDEAREAGEREGGREGGGGGADGGSERAREAGGREGEREGGGGFKREPGRPVSRDLLPLLQWLSRQIVVGR